MQTNVGQLLDPLTKIAQLDGVLLKDIDVTTAGVRISHSLRRQPLGWYIVDKTAVGDVFRTDWDVNFITLQSSASTTINLWVF